MDCLVVEVQGGIDFDPVEFERNFPVVSFAFGVDDPVGFASQTQQAELKSGGVNVVGVVQLNKRNFGQVVFSVVENDVFQFELVTVT